MIAFLIGTALIGTTGAVACLTATQEIASGAILTDSGFERTDCPATGAPSTPFVYDGRLRVIRAGEAIKPGDMISRFPGYGQDRVWPGQKVNIEIAIGPVAVQRTVEALQSALPGQTLFVRAGDGSILSAIYGAGR